MKIKRNGYLDREKLGIHLYARYMCVCCVMQYYEEVAEIKMYEVNCGRLFESVFSKNILCSHFYECIC